MEITKKAADQILKVFAEGTPEAQGTLAITSPLWFTGLLAFGAVEGVVDVAKGAVESVGLLAGTVGDVTVQKMKLLEVIKVALNLEGAEIQVEFEGDIYKYEQAKALLETLPPSDSRSDDLFKAMIKAMHKNR